MPDILTNDNHKILTNHRDFAILLKIKSSSVANNYVPLIQ